jgi:hypothetical protein
MRASDRVEFGVGVGCTEWVEPLDTSVVSREVVTAQVIWKGENKPHLSNTEPYQSKMKKRVRKQNRVEFQMQKNLPNKSLS